MQTLTQSQINKFKELHTLNKKIVEELGDFLEEIYPKKLDGRIELAEDNTAPKLGELLSFPEKFPNIGKRSNKVLHTD